MMAAAMKPGVPTMLSFNGGYADTAGYLALQGLFTSHVTGNFVTLAADDDHDRNDDADPPTAQRPRAG
jgi:uncharacterized membrane protein YoaK (UPF0700 family)